MNTFHLERRMGRSGRIIGLFLLMAFMVCFAMVPLALANEQFTLDPVAGIWIDAKPTGAADGLGTNEIRWGSSTGQGRSGYRFDGSSGGTFDLGEEFLLGAFWHFNWPIYPPAITSADLEVTLHFTDPLISPDPVFTYTFNHEETPNYSCGSGNCAYSPCQDPGCPDRVTFPSNYGEESFLIDDTLYTLKILGFVRSWPGSTPINEFITQEEKNNKAYLIGQLSSVLVPRPNITINKKTSCDGTNWYEADTGPGPYIPVGDMVYWRYIVQNTGNVDLTDITVTDDQGVTVTCGQTTLAPGEVMTCTATGTATAGQYENIATVTADHSGGSVSDDDPSHYFGFIPDCADYDVEYLGASFNGMNTSFTYRVSADSSPAVSHWVLALDNCIDETDILSCSPTPCGFVDPDPTTGLRGIKFDDLEIEAGSQEFSFVLAGHWFEGDTEAAIKAGSLICNYDTTGPVCTADLVIAKSDSPDPVCAGNQLTYTLTVENNGPSDAHAVVVTDQVPGLFTNAEYSTNGGSTWDPYTSGNPISLGTIAYPGSAEIFIRATAGCPSPCPQIVSNAASVTASTADPDASNNSATIDTTVEDCEDPVITCPNDLTLECGVAGNETAYTDWLAAATATDDCSTPTITHNGPAFSVLPKQCASGAGTTVTWTATDGCDNTDQCSAVVRILDRTPPVITTCPTDLDLNCTETIPQPGNDWAGFIAAGGGASDGCDSQLAASYTESSVGSCPTVITRTWTVTDDCGLSDTCVQTITQDDTTDPVITCPNDLTLECGVAGNETAYTDWLAAATATDDCSTPTITHNGPAFSVLPKQCASGAGTTVTWTATDGCDNTDQCSAVVRILDRTPPVITTCPTDLDLNCTETIPQPGNDWAGFIAAGGGASDGCDSQLAASYTESSVGSCPTVITRTWTVTDDCGLSDTCVQTITQDDTTDPVITCPNDLTLECGVAGNETAYTDWLAAATATDDCSTPTITHNGPAFSVLPKQCASGAGTTVTWTATDGCDNTDQCSAVVRILDRTPPVITTCPTDLDLNCTETIPQPGNDWAGFIAAGGGASDGCDSQLAASYTESSVGSCPTVITRTWTVTDDCGLSDTCVQTITQDDTTDPVITCPNDLTLECGVAGNETAYTDWLAAATATDDCSTPTITHNGPAFSVLPKQCASGAGTTVTWTATDGCDNTDQCSAVVRILDRTPPVITTCPTDLDLNCTETIPQPGNDWAGFIAAGGGASDGCDSQLAASYTESSVGSCPTVITRTWTVTDDCGLSDTCVQTITQDDTTDPVITCPNDLTLECGVAGNETAYTDWLAAATATDDCSTPTITHNGPAFSVLPKQCASGAGTTVTWTATDGCDNTDQCSAVVRILDRTPPVITTCPTDLDLNCTETIPQPGNDWAGFIAAGGGASDGCDSQLAASYTESSVGSCPTVITRTWTVTDDCGLSDTCVQTITQDDTTDPVITCPNDLTLECGVAGNETAYTDWLAAATATDDCSTPTITHNGPAFSVLPKQCASGAGTTVTWTATDGCDNTDQCSAVVRILDRTPPVITTCPTDLDLNCTETIPQPGNDWAGFIAAGGGASDGCDSQLAASYTESSVGSCPTVITRTWTVTDDCGLSDTCVQTITQDDTTDPVITCPNDLTLECGVAGNETAYTDWLAAATATDDCSTPTITHNGPAFSVLPKQCASGAGTTVTWTATDGCDNTDQCSAVVRILDRTPPVITTCPTDLDLNCTETIPQPGNDWAGFIAAGGGASDGCDSQLAASYTESSVGSCPTVITRTWTVTDDCGLSDTCVQTITQDDTTDPVITCPNDLTLECGVAGNETAYTDWLAAATATDDCSTPTITHNGPAFSVLPKQCASGAGTTVTWTATDGCDNTDQCSAVVRILDRTPPVITTCPTDLDLNCTETIPQPGNDWAGFIAAGGGASDGCDSQLAASYTESSVGSCPTVITRTWTVTDDCGLSDTCVQTITQDDTTDPVITCPNDLTLECGVAGNETAYTDWLAAATATDDCSTPTITHNGPAFSVLPKQCASGAGTTVTWTATDGCDNTDQCSAVVRILDRTPPVITTCPTDLDLNCTETIPQPGNDWAGFIAAGGGASDGCDSQLAASYTESSVGSCPTVITRTWTVTDDCGLSDTCVQTITQDDTTDPVITCPNDLTLECGVAGNETAYTDWLAAATATDDCSTPTITHNGPAFSVLPKQCASGAGTTVTWTATDGCDNTDQCSAVVRILDRTPPVITTCPTDLDLNCTETIPQPGNDWAGFIAAGGGASDGCDSQLAASYTESSVGSCPTVITRTWTVTDDCGLSDTCVQTITQDDTTDPVITCPNDLTLECGVAGNETAYTDWLAAATATDDCSTPTITHNGPAFSVLPKQCASGAGTTVTWTATDGCDNTDQCSAVVRILDRTPPVITTCPTDLDLNCTETIPQPGNDWAGFIAAGGGASDGCDSQLAASYTESSVGSCPTVITRTWTVTDDCGLSDTCVQTITQDDTTDPVITCPNDLTLECGVAGNETAYTDWLAAATATDDCSTPTITHNGPAFSVLPKQCASGAGTTVTWTATDGCDNTDQCSAVVRILDRTPPVITTCPTDLDLNCTETIPQPGNDWAGFIAAGGGASDGCDSQLAASYTESSVGSCPTVITRTWTVTDDCGLSDTCVQTITQDDTTDPVITCPNDLTLECGVAGNETAYTDWLAAATATDDCSTPTITHNGPAFSVLPKQCASGAGTTVTWTATDGCDNTDQCSAVVRILDRTPPVITTCPTDLDLNCTETIPQPGNDWAGFIAAGGGASDGCDSQLAASYTESSVGSCPTVITRTWTVTDDCGLSDTCVQTITQDDTTDPVITCPNDLTLECGVAGNETAYTDWLAAATATDDCSTPTITHNGPAFSVLPKQCASGAGTTVTWTATDGCDNTDQCSAVVRILDRTPPVITTCPTDLDLNCTETIPQPGNDWAGFIAAGGGASDGCDSQLAASYTESSVGSCPTVITRTWTVTDDCGLSDTCVQTITQDDTTDPVITCPNDLTLECGVAGNETAYTDWLAAATATDDCSTPTITHNGPAFSVLPKQCASGAGTTVTWTATDGCDNTDQCSAVVRILDRTPPVITTCPTDLDLNCTETIPQPGNDWAGFIAAGGGASDGCDSQLAASYTESSVGSCPTVITRTWTVTDDCGLSDTCVQTITQDDTTDPVITCPNDLTLECGVAGNETAYTDWLAAATATDDCSTPTITHNGPAFSVLPKQCASGAGTTVTWTATDGCDNTDQCSAVVRILDRTPPVITTCPTDLDLNCTETIPQPGNDWAGFIAAGGGASDGCDSQLAASYTESSVGSCPTVITRTWTVTDDCGLSDTCVQTITQDDTTDPVITCPNDLTLECGVAGNETAYTDWLAAATATDDCSTPTITHNGPAFSVLPKQCASGAGTTVTWTATDGCDNTDQCSAVVRILDRTPPVITTCPTDLDLNCTETIPQPGNDWAGFIAAGGGASDGCDSQLAASYTESSVGSCPTVITRTWTVTDDCGLSDTCVQTITQDDTTDPVITCPNDLTLECGVAGNETAYTDWLAAATATDDCSTPTITHNGPAFSVLPKQCASGAGTTVTWTATDGCDNTDQCSAVVRILDRTPPVITTCPTDLDLNCTETIPQPGNDWAGFIAAGGGASDGCDSQLAASYTESSVGSCPTVITRTWTVTDDCGLSDTCVQTITQDDTTDPVITCPNDLTLECGVAGNETAYTDWLAAATATDDCSTPTITHNGPAFSVLPKQCASGAGTTVTWTATDGCDNTDQCSAVVRILDRTPPVITTCPTDLDLNCTETIPQPGNDWAGFIAAGGGASDGCDSQLAASYTESSVGSCPTVITRTWTVTDDCGLSDTCVQTITQDDTTDPVITCPNDLTLECGVAGNETAYTDWLAAATATDDCSTPTITHNGPAFSVLPKQCASGAGTTVTWTATDGCDNTDQCSAVVRILDRTPPVITTCPTDLDLNCTETIPQPGNDWAGFIAAGGGASDGCDSQLAASYTESSVGSCPTVITRTWTVTDDCGLSDTCVQTITQDDTTDPVITCPNDLTLECGVAGNETAYTDWLAAATATDDCSTPTITHNGPAFSVLPKQCASGAGTTVTWTATDGCDNTDQCSAVVRILDRTPPVITTCPTDLDLNCTETIPQPGNDWAGFIAAGGGASDGCDSQLAASYTESSVGSCPTVITRTWTVTDDCGLSDTCVQTITQDDTTDPVITCPNDLTLECGVAGNETAYTDWLAAATATDDCSTPTITHNGPAFSVLPKQCASGAGTTVTWTATDGCDNTDQCSAVVRILDRTPPVITTCPTDLDLNCTETIPQPGNDWAGFIAAGGGASDGCDSQLAASYTESSVGSCPTVITRTWTVTDDCGLSDTCVQTITQDDTTDPVITCPNDLTLECGVAGNETAYTDWLAAATATDDCSTPTITHNGPAFSVLPKQCASGAGTTVTWTATDGCDNTDQCSAVVRILDRTPPVITTCPTDLDLNCTETIPQPGNDWAGFIAAGGGASDGCDSQLAASYTESSVGSCPTVITRTWTVTDDCGLSDTCVQTITQDDTTDPVITCPNDLTLECGVAGNETAYTDWLAAATATDDCSTPTITHNGPAFSVLPKQCASGAGTTVTWTATDGCDNTDQCSAVVRILDRTPPVITTCPTDLDLNCTETIPQPGNDWAGFIAAGGGASDGCDSQLAASYTESSVGSCPTVITRTWTVTDDCGLSDTCVQTITQDDTTDPVITCPNDLTLECGVAGNETAYTDWLAAATATDDCSTPTITHNGPAFSVLPKQCASGAGTTVTWTATDGCDNTDQCSAVVRILDRTPPVITTCPTDLDLNCTETIPQPGNDWAGFIAAGGGASDGCDSQLAASYTESSVGSCPTVITRTWTVTDDCGLSDTCVQTITQDDTTDPVITCPNDLTLECGVAGNETAYTDWLAAATATDDCSTPTITHNGPAFSVLPKQCASGAGTTVTWTATDGCDNTDQCSAVVRILDRTPPVITTCPTDLDLNCTETIPQPGNDWAGFIAAGGGASDGCDSQLAASYTESSVGSCPTVITRTWTVTDDCGLSDTCVQTITQDDTTDPVITCPNDLTLECGVAGNETAYTDWLAAATATDDCSTPTITHNGPAFSVLPKQCASGAGTTVTWTATDGCDNTDQCSAVVRILDRTPPVITTCPTDLDLNCTETIPQPGNDWAGFIAAGGGASDGCDSQLAASYTESSVGSCPTVITRTWTVTDDCGLSDTCVQTITQDDTTPPVITCPQDLTLECGDIGNEAAYSAWLASATATDDCSTPTITHNGPAFSALPKQCAGDAGTTVTWTATDGCDNTAQCSAVVKILDTTDPVITTCPPNLVLDCAETVPAPDNSWAGFGTAGGAANDNCDTTLEASYSDATAGTCPTVITRTWTVTDDCGLTATCVQTITQDDTTPPVITCPNPISVQCPGDVPAPNTSLVSATDNCDPTPTITHEGDVSDNNTCPETITRTYRATDACGNWAECTQIITVVDTTDPVITCPPNITVSSDPDACGADVTVPTPTASDNCGVASVTNDYNGTSDASGFYPVGTTTVIWTVTDNCGNTAQCSHTVTVTLNAELSITKVADKTSATVGDTITYTITVTNTGNVTVSNVTVNDLKLGVLSGPSGDDGNGVLDVNEIWTYTGSYVVTEADLCAPITNTATATATDPCGNAVGPVTAQAIVTPTYTATLGLTKTVDPPFDENAATVGDVITYTIIVTNEGNVGLSNVLVSDPLIITLNGPQAGEDANNPGVLDPSETWTYTGSYAVIAADIGGPIVNTATANATDPCDNLVEASDSATVPWVNSPPTAQGQSLTTCKNTPLTFFLMATDPDVDPEDPEAHPLTFKILGAPGNGAVSGNLAAVIYTAPHRALVQVTYTPTWNFLGTDTFTFLVEDPFEEFSTGVVEITVEECEEPVGGGGAIAPDIVINEVAWGGTDANTEHEWIELVSNSGQTIDLDGWVLRWRRKQPTTPEERKWKVVELSGTIAPYGYYLLERHHDKVVSDIQADLIYDTIKPYHLELRDLGEVMELIDPEGLVVDTANADHPERDGWPAGTGPSAFGTMERIDPLLPDLDENWATNRGIIINGSDAQSDLLTATATMVNEEALIRALLDQVPQVVRVGERITVTVAFPSAIGEVEELPHVTLIHAGGAAGGGGAVLEPLTQGAALSGGQTEGLPNYEFTLDTAQLAPGTYQLWIVMGNRVFHYLSIEIVEA